MNTNQIISLLQEYFSGQPVTKAYLFGSYARKEQGNDSDIDILIELDPKIPIGLEYAQMYVDLEKLTGKEVDLVTEKSLSKYVKPYVDREKILIYERKAS
jgi:predicted nucleotidyltransferase